MRVAVFLTALNLLEFLCLFFVDLIDDDSGFQFVVELTFYFFIPIIAFKSIIFEERYLWIQLIFLTVIV